MGGVGNVGIPGIPNNFDSTARSAGIGQRGTANIGRSGDRAEGVQEDSSSVDTLHHNVDPTGVRLRKTLQI